ncbi:MAG: polysaccharide biosynthesis tyrosine autokinase [Acetobacteraceae bacterium]
MTLAISLSPPASGFDIGRLVLGLLRRWPLLLCMTFGGIVLGFWMQKVLPPKYASTVSILLEPKRPGAISDDGQFANLQVDSTKIGTVASIIESSTLLSRVVQSENLADDPDFNAPMPSVLDRGCTVVRQWVPFPVCDLAPPEPNTREAREARALYRLQHSVTTTRVNFTYVIQVQVVAPKANDAQRLATAVAEAYLDDQFKTRQEAAVRDTTWLASQLAEMRTELIASEEKVEALRKQYGLTETAQGPNSTTDRQVITELTAQMVTAESNVATEQARYQQVQRIRKGNGDLGSLPEAASSQTIQQLRLQQTEVDRKIADLTARYTANYPGLIDAERDKRALDTRIAAEVGRIAESIHNDYETAVARRDELKKMLGTQVDTTQDDTSSTGRVKLREAQRIVEANQAFYDAQLRRLREAELMKTRQDVEARILSPADMPTAPKFPKRAIFLLLGAVVGLMGGVVIVGSRLLLENRFVTAAWTEDTLGLPILGLLPLVRRREMAGIGRRSGIQEYLRAKPLSRFAESLRSLRAGLRNSTPIAPRIIHVTSSVPGEGKSTVAAALATSAAIAGLRTVLVDLDIRNSSVSNLFHLQESKGVVDVIQGNSMIGTALQTFDQLPLTVMAVGQSSRLSPDMIGSPRFGAMIQKLANDFDMVILDSPPILAVSDSVLIANVSDATLFIVQWRTTPKDIVKQGIKVLRANGATLAGVVFNKMDLSKAPQYEGSGYGAYYRGIDNYVSD